MIIEFKYAIQQQVIVKALGMPGIVEGGSWDGMFRMYRIAYWNNGDRFQQWLHEHEITTDKTTTTP